MGGTAVKAGIIDENNKIINKTSIPSDSSKPFEMAIKELTDGIKALAKETGFSIEDFPCLGIGMPSYINPKTGLLIFSNNMGWKNVPIKNEIEKYIPVPVFIGNDADCAVLGEAIAGAARGKDNVVMITLGTGVGGGVILNRKLFCGGDGMGCELGHMCLIMDGEKCTCGLNGCVEAYASVTALIRQTKAMMEKYPQSIMYDHVMKEGSVTGKTAFDCAKLGDEAANAVVEQYLKYLTAAVGSYITIFRPDVFLIGGGLSNEKDYLLKPLNENVGDYVFAADITGVPPIIKAELGNDAGIIGAAYLDMF